MGRNQSLSISLPHLFGGKCLCQLLTVEQAALPLSTLPEETPQENCPANIRRKYMNKMALVHGKQPNMYLLL